MQKIVKDFVQVEIDGREISIEVENVSGININRDSDSDSEDVSFTQYNLDSVKDDIVAIANSFYETLKGLKPDKIGIEFGVEIGVESGKLTSLIVKGTGKSNLKVNLQWDLKKEA